MAGIGRMVVDASEWVGQSYAHGILSGWISLFEAPVQWVFYQSYQFRDALSSASDNGCYQSARPSATDKSEPDFFRQVSEPTIRSGASRTIPRSKGSLGGDAFPLIHFVPSVQVNPEATALTLQALQSRAAGQASNPSTSLITKALRIDRKQASAQRVYPVGGAL